MKRYVLLLPVMFGVVAGCHAASPSFSSFYTNHFTTNNLVIKANLNPTQFDTNSSSITITITNVSGIAGGSLWTNISGVIQPRSGQTTNALSFTSASSDNATNTVLTVDTVNVWTDQNTKLLQLRHVGTNVAYVTPYGSFESGKGVAWAGPSRDDLFLGVHDTALGESDYALIYGAAIDGSSPTNYAEFSAQMNSGASPAGTLNLAALTNGVSSYFQVTVQPDQSVARIELQSQGQRTFYVEDQTGYSGAGTKMLGDDGKYHDGLVLWTNISNVLQPLVGFDVLVTNLTSVDSLVANGSFHLNGVVSSNLIANTNNLNPFQVGTFQLVGPSTTASDSRITLSTGIGYQFLVIQNSDTNSAFNMRNGEPQWDDPSSVIHLSGGDWNTTNKGDGMLLYHNGLFWSEIGRFFANTNTSTPVVMNPTDLYLPVRESAGVFADSPLHTPSAGDTNVIVNGSLYSGPNSFTYWGDSDYSFVSVHDVGAGEPDANGLAVWTVLGNRNGAIDGNVSTNNAYFSVGVANGSSGSSIIWSSTMADLMLDGQYGFNNPSVFRMHPTVTDLAANAAYTFDTATNVASADLVRVKNNGTNLVTIGPSGGIGFGPHANGASTNVMFRNDRDLVYTNGAAAVNFEVRKGDGASAKLGLTTGSHAILLGGTSSDVYVGVNNNGSGDYVFQNSGFSSTSAGTDDLGSVAAPWDDVYTDKIILTGITKVQKAALTPADGMIVYQTDNTPGFRGYVNGSWVMFSTVADP